MPPAKLFNMAGDQVGEVALSEAVFGVEPNESVLHDSVKNHLANCRQGTQSALTKGEVSYSTAKPWRQKGTGRARAGYKGSPVWTHGGVAFAPKPRDYSYTLNKKVKRLALKSALSAKAAAGEILVVDGLAVEEIKTAPVKAFLTKIGAEGKALLVTEQVDEQDSFSRDGLAEKVFEDSEPARKAFETAAEVRHLPERVAVDRRAVAQKRVRCHRIVTDTGIEVSFPAEYGDDPEFIQFSTEENGLISIELKNIGSIENK